MTHYSLRPLLLPPLPVLHQLHWWRWKSLVCDKSSTTAIHLLGTTLNVITDCEPFLHPPLSPSESHFCCTAPNLAEAFSHIRLSHCTIQDKGGGGGWVLNSCFAIAKIRLQGAATALLKSAYLTIWFYIWVTVDFSLCGPQQDKTQSVDWWCIALSQNILKKM